MGQSAKRSKKDRQAAGGRAGLTVLYSSRGRVKKKGNRSVDWSQRAARLEAIGFASYTEYLESPRWRELATGARLRAEGLCQLCNSGGETHVHHRTYARLGTDAERRDLILLCARCHSRFHGQVKSGGQGQKRQKRKTARKRASDRPLNAAGVEAAFAEMREAAKAHWAEEPKLKLRSKSKRRKSAQNQSHLKAELRGRHRI
jgi:HNH endonuclease